MALLAVMIIANPQTGDEAYMYSRVIQIIDDYFVVGGAMGSLFTGLAYSIWTNWGFFKYKWIIVKWIMTILQILFGTFVLGPCVNSNVEIADKLRDAALTNPEYLQNAQTSLILGAIQTTLLILYIIVSVQKPWKKKK